MLSDYIYILQVTLGEKKLFYNEKYNMMVANKVFATRYNSMDQAEEIKKILSKESDELIEVIEDKETVENFVN